MDTMYLSPSWLSLKTATIASIAVFLVGTIGARLIARNSFTGKRILEASILFSIVLPPTVLGLCSLYLFGNNGLIGIYLVEWFDVQIVFTWYAVIIAAIVVSFPLMYQSASAAFQQYDANIEHAAYTMGASKW